MDLVCGPASPLPETHQRYRLVAHIGSGGQAEVYRAVRVTGGVSSAPMTVKVFRVDPRKMSVTRTVLVPEPVRSLAVGEGGVWVVAGSRLRRISLRTDPSGGAGVAPLTPVRRQPEIGNSLGGFDPGERLLIA